MSLPLHVPLRVLLLTVPPEALANTVLTILMLAILTKMSILLFNIFVYPFHLSPLRHLPGPLVCNPLSLDISERMLMVLTPGQRLPPWSKPQVPPSFLDPRTLLSMVPRMARCTLYPFCKLCQFGNPHRKQRRSVQADSADQEQVLCQARVCKRICP